VLYRKVIITVFILFCCVQDSFGHNFFGGPGQFIRLRDAPEEHDYTDQAGNMLSVNSAEEALEFTPGLDCIVFFDGDIVTFNDDFVTYCGT
jgi:hypothetical protein